MHHHTIPIDLFLARRLADTPEQWGPFDYVDYRQIQDRVHWALSMLTHRERQVIGLLFGFEGPDRSVPEVAKVLDCPISRVRYTKRKAMDMLRGQAHRFRIWYPDGVSYREDRQYPGVADKLPEVRPDVPRPPGLWGIDLLTGRPLGPRMLRPAGRQAGVFCPALP